MSTATERRTIYLTRRWQRLRGMKLKRNPLCERCAKDGLTVGAEIVHHIVHIRKGGPAFPPLSGLESLCQECHNAEHSEGQAAPTDEFFRMAMELT